jgi:hypothetical protein
VIRHIGKQLGDAVQGMGVVATSLAAIPCFAGNRVAAPWTAAKIAQFRR